MGNAVAPEVYILGWIVVALIVYAAVLTVVVLAVVL